MVFSNTLSSIEDRRLLLFKSLLSSIENDIHMSLTIPNSMKGTKAPQVLFTPIKHHVMCCATSGAVPDVI